MNADRLAAYTSKWMAAADLPDDGATLTISNVTLQKVENRGGPAEKLALHFRDRGFKPLLLNKVNYNAVKRTIGTAETDQWIGRRVTLRREMASTPDGVVPCIRVAWMADRADGHAVAAAMTSPPPPPTDADAPPFADDDLPF